MIVTTLGRQKLCEGEVGLRLHTLSPLIYVDMCITSAVSTPLMVASLEGSGN